MTRKNINITQFTSAYDHSLVTMVDYDPSASAREKREALRELKRLSAEDYIKEHRPRVWEELVKA